MLPVISLLILAFAVSLDGFGVGVMYGLRKIRIPFLSIGIISLWSGAIIFISMQIGVLMSSFMSSSDCRTHWGFDINRHRDLGTGADETAKKPGCSSRERGPTAR